MFKKLFISLLLLFVFMISIACSSPASVEVAEPLATVATAPTPTPLPTDTPMPPPTTPPALPSTETPIPEPTSTPDTVFAYANSPENLQLLFETIREANLAGDYELAATLTVNLLPNEACITQALKDEATDDAATILEMYNEMIPATEDATILSQLFATDPERSQVNVHGATTEEIAADTDEFPGGAKDLAQTILRPQTTFYEVEYVEPGNDLGMKFHLFLWHNEQWCMFGPAWRAF